MDSGGGGGAALRPSALDLVAALLTGRGRPEEEGWPPSLAENRHLLVLLTTSLAVLVGCGVALLVRRSSISAPAARAQEPQPRAPAPAKRKQEAEPDPDDGRQRVAVFFGTQTGTAEGFAKVG
jgi:NADPH-ferrihemoprotein reductase